MVLTYSIVASVLLLFCGLCKCSVSAAVSAFTLFVVGYQIAKQFLIRCPTFLDFSSLVGTEWASSSSQHDKKTDLGSNGPYAPLPGLGLQIPNQNDTRDQTFTRLESSSQSQETPLLPWKDLLLPNSINLALTEIIELALKTYIHSWYLNEISEDQAFLLEVRYQIRYIAASVCRRLNGFDLTGWILHKVVPVSVNHAEIYTRVRKHHCYDVHKKPAPDFLEQRVLEYIELAGNLHKAACCRDTELTYLRTVACYLSTKLTDQQRVAGFALPVEARNFNKQSRLLQWFPNPQTFLQELVVFAFLLPVMDIIGDPDIINKLIILLFDPEPMEIYPDNNEEQVELLTEFTSISPNQTSDSLLQINLDDIVKRPNELYKFMNFLKATGGPLNYLQFILAASELQDRLSNLLYHHNRDSEQEAFAHCNWEAWELFKNYLHTASPDKIDFPTELVREFEAAVESKSENSAQLIESAVLQAYRLIYQWLQTHYVVTFYQSEEYKNIICSDRPSVSVNKYTKLNGSDSFKKPLVKKITSLSPVSSSSSMSGLSGETGIFTLSKFKNKLAGMFRSPVEDGAFVVMSPSKHIGVNDFVNETSTFYTSDNNELELDEDFIDIRHASTDLGVVPPIIVQDTDDEDDVSLDDLDMVSRNMNQWTVSIPRVEPRRDLQSGKTMYVYVVYVLRNDLPDVSHSWYVDRRYAEFYILESKLLQFHGEAVVTPFLPTKKPFANKGRAFVESLRPSFEGFLQRLIENPVLKASELVHAFLTSPLELTSNFFPDSMNPWKAMKRVPAKLLRERGQNLAPFIDRLVTSAEPDSMNKVTKSRSDVKFDYGGGTPYTGAQSAETEIRDKIYGTVFGNNFGLETAGNADENNGNPLKRKHRDRRRAVFDPLASSVYDTVLFVAVKVLHLSHYVFALLVSLRMILRDTVDSLLDRLLRFQLRRSLHERRIVELIELLRDTLFFEEDIQRTNEQKRQRTEEALESLRSFLLDVVPWQLMWIVGRERVTNLVTELFECLQHPKLNKHLSYVLLDLLLLELFPELDSASV